MSTSHLDLRIRILELEFELRYHKAIKSEDPSKVQSQIQKMSELSEKITDAINTTPTDVHLSLTWDKKKMAMTDPTPIENEIQEKIRRLISRAEFLRKPTPLQPHENAGISSMPPPSSITDPHVQNSSLNPPVKTAKNYAAGFENPASNCWLNALLSMLVFVPSMRIPYEEVARFYAAKNMDDPSQLHGVALKEALNAYDTALRSEQPVNHSVIQNVRHAFNHFFGSKNTATQREVFSKNCWHQEDACEAMQLLMSEYERILRIQDPNAPDFSSLYTLTESKRHYLPTEEQREADPLRVLSDGYSRLTDDNCSSSIHFDYQILLDIHNKKIRPRFGPLLKKYFKNIHVGDHEQAQYLLSNGKVQNFKLTAESRRFVTAPNEFILTIKRFGSHSRGNTYKITTSIGINRIIALPPEATRENKQIAYEMDSFIVHDGTLDGGHYICYKKIEGRWIEVNDARIRFVDENEIDQILHSQKKTTFTSYMHHYTRILQSQQEEAIEEANNALLEEFKKQWITSKLAFESIEKLAAGSIHLEKLPPDILETLRYVVWLNDQTPNEIGYGTRVLQKNPQKLKEIKLPWLIGSKGTPLIDQILSVQTKKLAIHEEQLKEAELHSFLVKLNNSSFANEELLLAFKALAEEIQRDIYDKYDRGAALSGDLGKTLLETKEPIVEIVEQLAASYGIRAEKLEHAYEKEQLQAFRELLTHYPTHTLQPKQLAKAFERLEISEEIKEKLYGSICGAEEFYKNPRRLLTITSALIAGSSVASSKPDVLQQMTALLENDSLL